MLNDSKRDDVVARLRERQQWKQHNFVPGSRVVWFDDERRARAGTVLWIGELVGLTGVFAGVNFDDPIITGATGRYRGRQLFKTKPNHAAFVQTHGLFAEEDYIELTASDSTVINCISTVKTQQQATVECKELVVGDRVAYTNRVLIHAVRYGVLKWIGALEGFGDEKFAGIEFDEPVGYGTGYFKGKQLFTTKSKHALFVRYSEIIREADHLNMPSSLEASSSCGLKLKSMAIDSERCATVVNAETVNFVYTMSKLGETEETKLPEAVADRPIECAVLGRATGQPPVDTYEPQHCKVTADLITDEEDSAESDESIASISDTVRLQLAEFKKQPHSIGKAISVGRKVTGPIREGERIEWIDSEAQPQLGVVKWIGRLFGHTRVYGGIEFDEPIGGGTGVHRDEQIFVAKQNHALFVPYDQLRREEQAITVNYLHDAQPLKSTASISSTIEGTSQAPLDEPVLPRPIPIASSEIPPAYIDCPSGDFAIGWRVDGDFSSPFLFYLQHYGDSEARKQLSAEIKPPNVVMDRPTVGSVCIAEFRGDWYRAQITSVDADDDAVTVLFIDYGNTEVKKLTEVYHITDEQPEIVRTMRKLALPCKLDGVQHGRLEWSATMVDEFQLAFPEAEFFKVAFKSIELGVHVVDVIVDERPLIDLLLKNNIIDKTDITVDQVNQNVVASCSSASEDKQENAADRNTSESSSEPSPTATSAIDNLSINESATADADNMCELKIALKTAICNILQSKQHIVNVEGTLVLRFKQQAAQPPIELDESYNSSDLSILDAASDTDLESDLSVVDFD